MYVLVGVEEEIEMEFKKDVSERRKSTKSGSLK